MANCRKEVGSASHNIYTERKVFFLFHNHYVRLLEHNLGIHLYFEPEISNELLFSLFISTLEILNICESTILKFNYVL